MTILSPKSSQWLARIMSNHRSNSYKHLHQIETQTRQTSTTSSSKGQSLTIGSFSVVQKPKLDLTFEDSKTAFKAKTNLELLRGLLVFQLCGINLLIDNQKSLLKISRKLLGKTLFTKLMRATFYGHFVAGEDQNDIRPKVENMMKYGVKSILDYSAEEDLENIKETIFELKSDNSKLIMSMRRMYDPSELQSEQNCRIFYDCIDAVSDVTNQTGIGAIKLTSLLRPQLLLKLSSLISRIKVNEDKCEPDCLSWDTLLNKSLPELELHFNSLFKYLKRFDTKPIEDNEFTENEIGELRNMFLRMNDIAKHAVERNVRLFVDAEQTYFQDAIHRLTVELMRKFNKDRCVFLNTYQNYLKSAFKTLESDLALASKEKFYFGAKLVRGAYMDQERERAGKMEYEDPINESYEATTQMYEKCLVYCMDKTKQEPFGRVSVMVASHNESTVRFAVEKMEEYGINPNDRIVCFGQLLGMCDYISFYLGGQGYSVYKYLPYGPVEEVLPYLSRRATENKSVFEKLLKEKRLIATEISRRFKNLEFST